MKATWFVSLFLLAGMIVANNCAAEDADRIKGREIFEQHCEECHGIKAVGENPEKPQGGFTDENEYIAPALNGTGHTWHHPPIFLFQHIKKRKVNKSSPMPSFADILSDDDINAVLAYIKSLWPENIRERYYQRFKQ